MIAPARHATALETIGVTVPESAVEAFEAALGTVCRSVGLFLDDTTGLWRIEGVREAGAGAGELASALAVAGLVSGIEPVLERVPVAAEGWLARTRSAFPEQLVGRRFAIRGTHVTGPPAPGRITLVLDAGMAFGSGEHGSTRGCLVALERVAHRRPRRVLDLGTGSGILAMAAALYLHRPVLGVDIDPWAVRVARINARLNQLAGVRWKRVDGWSDPAVRAGGWDLVFANILARPLCRMATSLATGLAPGGTAILAGLLTRQVRWVLAAHRRHGLVLERVQDEGGWATLVLRAQPRRRA